MPPTLADRVWHILEAIQDIERALSNKTYDEFVADRLLRAAVERLVEIVCEATRRIPDEVQRTEPAIAWQKVIDFGNRLRHAYHVVDAAIVWQIVRNDLPPMKAFAQRIIAESESR
jgi:uncharacterized protein with HEPN domain